MTILDFILILLALAGIALIVYLIYTLNKLTKTIDKVNDLVDDNSEGISNIVENVDAVTADAKTLTGKATDVVEGVERGIKKPLTADNVSGIVSSTRDILDISKNAVYAAGIATTFFGHLKTSKENRRLKKEAKEQRKRAREERKAQRERDKMLKKELRKQRNK